MTPSVSPAVLGCLGSGAPLLPLLLWTISGRELSRGHRRRVDECRET